MKTNVSESMSEDTLATTSVGEQPEEIPPAYFATNGTYFVHAQPASAIKVERDTPTLEAIEDTRRCWIDKKIIGLFALAIGTALFLYFVYWMKGYLDRK